MLGSVYGVGIVNTQLLIMPRPVMQLLYFVRDPGRVVTPANIAEVVHVGCISGGVAGASGALLRLLK